MAIIFNSLIQVSQFVILIILSIILIELFLYYHLKFHEKKWFAPLGMFLFPILVFFGTTISEIKFTWVFFISSLIVEGVLILVFKFLIRGKYPLAVMLLAPGLIGLGFLIVYPLTFEVYLAFHDLKLTTIKEWLENGTLPFVGIKHFKNVFIKSPLTDVSFFMLLLRTIWWTFINVIFHVIGGGLLALLLNNKIKFRGIYRTLIIIPWAMPQVVAVLALRGEFHYQYGFINIMIEKVIETFPLLANIGFSPVPWLSSRPFLTCTIINIWLGIPFMMVIILGGLQSISKSYYDTASIDGASWLQKFRYITLPLLKPVLAPAVTIGAIWTFNNINVIYLVTGQDGGTEQADILVSALYKSAFTYYRYSYSAAFALIIFVILFTSSLLWLKFTKSSESVYG